MDWRKNLYHYEEQPPLKAWEAISSELNDDIPSLRDRMYNYESVPPAGVWQAVASEISGRETDQSPVIWYKKPWNVAAAAVTAAVVFGAVYFNSYKLPTGVSTAVINPVSPSSSQPDIPATPPAPQPSAQPAEPASLAAADATNKQSFGTSAIEKPARKKATPSRKKDDSNYIYFTSSNGEERRLSYKLQPLLPAIKEKKHNEMLDKWSTALEKSAFVPSGNNFFDIVDMIRMVDQRLP